MVQADLALPAPWFVSSSAREPPVFPVPATVQLQGDRGRAGRMRLYNVPCSVDWVVYQLYILGFYRLPGHSSHDARLLWSDHRSCLVSIRDDVSLTDSELEFCKD